MTEREIRSWLTDMDGVLVHAPPGPAGSSGAHPPLAPRPPGTEFLVLTNNSMYTPRDLAARLHLSPASTCPRSGSGPPPWPRRFPPGPTTPGGSNAYVIGEAGLLTALHSAGFVMTDTDPDFVVLGETHTYSFEQITRAIRLIAAGSRFISTNPDSTPGPAPAASCRPPAPSRR